MTQWALAKANRNGTKLTDGGACTKFMKPMAHTISNINPKGHEAEAINNAEQRYIFLTFVTVELDEYWKIVTPILLRVQGSDPLSDPKAPGITNNMDQVLSAISAVADQQRVTNLLYDAFSPKSVTPDHSSRMNIMGNIKNRIAEKLRKRVAKHSADSWQKMSDSSSVSCQLSASDPTSQVIDITKVEKRERSSRKKSKKKGKHNKRSARNISSIAKEEHIHEISHYDACHRVNLQFPNATDLIIDSLDVEQYRQQGDMVEINAMEDVEHLNSEDCPAASNLWAACEFNVVEESHKMVSSEASNKNIKVVQEASSPDLVTSSPRSVQSFNDALPPFSLKSVDGICCGGPSIGSFYDSNDTCISHIPLDGVVARESLNISTEMSKLTASKEANVINSSDGETSEDTICSMISCIAPSGLECPSHDNSCNLREDMLHRVHFDIESFTENSLESPDRVSWSSGSCNSIEEDEFIPSWKARRRSKSNKSSSGPSQRFSSSTDMHDRGVRKEKDGNHHLWQVSAYGDNGGDNVPKCSRHVCLPKGDLVKDLSSFTRYGSRLKKGKHERSGTCMTLRETPVRSDPTEGEISKNKSSDMCNLKLTLESKLENNSHPKKHLPVRIGLKDSEVKELSFHNGIKETAKQLTHHNESASKNSDNVTCSALEATEDVITDSCSSYGAQNTETRSSTAYQLVEAEPASVMEEPFENELKSDKEKKSWSDLRQSHCASPANEDDRQASLICNSLQVHHVDESNLELEHGTVFKDLESVSHASVCLSVDAATEGGGINKSRFPFKFDLKQHERTSASANLPSMCIHGIDASTPIETTSCLNHWSSDQMMSISEDTLDKIVEAVHEAYTVQAESECIQSETGSDLADFEKVLVAASPVISPAFGSCNCTKCLGRDDSADLLCWDQIPVPTLGNVWQWYEEPSCYGLNVKVQSFHNPKRLGPNQHESCAYFLPLLSAIQLFRRTSRSSSSRSSDTSGTEAVEFQEAEAPDTLSNIWKFPVPELPKPSEVGVVDALVPKRLPCSSKACSSSGYEVHNVSCTDQFTDTSCSDGSVLLFEYFESERPQLRKPLSEKIKELVSADTSSYPQMYGNPSCLESLSLSEIHPASWYAVAWYPIYRIPEDSFRAAFLTYHSLGHFSTRSSSLKSPCQKESLIVSPVIGLQRYNYQGECWFSLKSSTMTTVGKDQASNPAIVLEKRLSTLEHAASMMSTASVCKGQHVSMNRHSDYDFFVSRVSGEMSWPELAIIFSE